jgi:hypothetical protein
MNLKPGIYEIRMEDRTGNASAARTKLVVKAGEVARASMTLR